MPWTFRNSLMALIFSLEKKQFLVACFLFHARKITQSPLWHTKTLASCYGNQYRLTPQSLLGSSPESPVLPCSWLEVESPPFPSCWMMTWAGDHHGGNDRIFLVLGSLPIDNWVYYRYEACLRIFNETAVQEVVICWSSFTTSQGKEVNQIFQTIPPGSITQSTFHFIFFFFVPQYRKGKGRKFSKIQRTGASHKPTRHNGRPDEF